MTASSKQGPESSLVGMRILIVEDEMLAAMLLEDMLTDLGCDVIKAGRVAKAVQFVANTEFDGAILDINVAGKLSILSRASSRRVRAENSHRPTRRRERQMQRFKSPHHAQRFLSAHAFIYGHFHPRRHRATANNYRASRAVAFSVWREETYVRKAA